MYIYGCDAVLDVNVETRSSQMEQERRRKGDAGWLAGMVERGWLGVGGWYWDGGGTLSTRTALAGGSLPSDPVLISTVSRLFPFPT